MIIRACFSEDERVSQKTFVRHIESSYSHSALALPTRLISAALALGQSLTSTLLRSLFLVHSSPSFFVSYENTHAQRKHSDFVPSSAHAPHNSNGHGH